MSIYSNPRAALQPPTPAPLVSALREAAKIIKSQSFQVSLRNTSAEPLAQQTTYASFAQMFSKTTKRFKMKLKQQKRSRQNQNTNSTLIIGPCAEPRGKLIASSALLASHQGKWRVKTATSEPHFKYSQIQINSGGSSGNKRRTTITKSNQRIRKGSTVSRLTFDHKNSNKAVARAQGEGEGEGESEGQFSPIGLINVRYSREKRQPVQAPNQQMQEIDDSPLKQIYDKIFVKINHSAQENNRSRNYRNLRKFYSSHRVSCQAGGKEKKIQRHVYVSNKNIPFNPPKVETEPSFRADGLLENSLSPWAEEKFY